MHARKIDIGHSPAVEQDLHGGEREDRLRRAGQDPRRIVAVEEQPPDLALVDIGLPGMDGYVLGESLRTRPWAHNLILVAVTGRGQEDDRERSRTAGFREHLVKPVALESLRTVINDSVSRETRGRA